LKVKKPTFENSRGKKNPFTECRLNELNDHTYNFLIDNTFSKTKKISLAHVSVFFVRKSISEAACVLPSCRGRLQVPKFPQGRAEFNCVFTQKPQDGCQGQRGQSPISSVDQTHPSACDQVRTTILEAN
jgi:hypothetical protein